MQRIVAVVLLLLLLGVGAFFWLWGDDTAPIAPDPDSGQAVAEERDTAKNAFDNLENGGAAPGAALRTEVAVGIDGLLDDPEIQAGLAGFRGRVVTHNKVPVADCGVRMYRGAMDVVLRDGVDLFADEPTLVPEYIGGEVQTRSDGTFLMTGVWPRAIYLMFAGIGTDAPMHQVITKTPSPGEIIDLGDIALPDAGVIVGHVVDEDGEPLPGALVRCADLPGTLAGFFPFERFDPDGALLIRERGSPVNVVEMPGWVKDAWEHVPIPTTYTDSEGHFRLVGVTPGSNLLAVTAKNCLSDMKPSVRVRAGEEKDVGRIRLKSGEELVGKVVDAAGEPVPDAEVFAGSTIAIAPVDLARRVEKTNVDGEFRGLGFAPGKVTVAARRSPSHAWVLADPQPILGEVVVTLLGAFEALVTVKTEAGEAIAEPRFRLLRGRAGDGAAEMAAFGFVPPMSLRDRLSQTEEGPWRFSNLLAGKYTLVAEAPGFATGFVGITIVDAAVSVDLVLTGKRNFAVRVVDHENNPIRNVAIVAEVRGRSLFDMPINCGRTKADGTLTIDKFQADKLRVSADHPKWGVVHGEVTPQEELVLQMQPPGSIEGLLTENGAPAELGKHTVIVEWRRGDGPRGPIETVPQMVSAGLDGRFVVKALQPGQYRLTSIDSLDALQSPGGMMTMFMSQSMGGGGDRQRETVQVVSGQATQVQLDTGQKPIEGPTAHVFGSVSVDGRLSEGAQVMGWIENRRFAATVDRAGRFDLGIVPAGGAWVSITEDGGFFGLSSTIWSGNFTLSENEEKELRIEVMTSEMSGMIVTPDGSAATGMTVQARGTLKGGDSNVYLHAPVDSNGNFSFKKVAEGKWTLEVQGGGRDRMRGKLEGVEVTAGVPAANLRLEVREAITVKGKVDMAMFTQKPEWAWISIHELNSDGSLGSQVSGIGIDTDDGGFETRDLTIGSYGVRLHAQQDKSQKQFRCQNLDVPPLGLSNVLLRGTPE